MPSKQPVGLEDQLDAPESHSRRSKRRTSRQKHVGAPVGFDELMSNTTATATATVDVVGAAQASQRWPIRDEAITIGPEPPIQAGTFAAARMMAGQGTAVKRAAQVLHSP